MKTAATFLAEPAWATLLDAVGLRDFRSWWSLDLPAVEPGNHRRGGWSSVSRHLLPLPDGNQAGVYIKRQEDHVYRSWRHPLTGCLTGAREFQTLLRCRAAGVAAAEPVLYAEQQADGHQRGILVTRELAGYRALEDLTADWQRDGLPPRRQRLRLLQAIATAVRALHEAHFEHNCMYPKHLMIHTAWLEGIASTPAPVVLIDLEKAKWRLWRGFCTRRDLDSLHRHSAGWSRTDRRRFLGWYLAAGPRLPRGGRRLWRNLAQRGT